MRYPVQEAIYQGETLRLELRFRGEDLTGGVPRVAVSAGLEGVDFEVSLEGVDTVVVRAVRTDLFAIGRHVLEVWLDWPLSTPVCNELALIIIVIVSKSEDAE